MTVHVEVIVTCDSTDAALQSRAAHLATKLGLRLSAAADASPDALLLVVGQERLELREPEGGGHRVSADFLTAGRRGVDLSRRQPLVRAIGPRGNPIVDATGGLGRDAALLWRLGYEVTMIERSPVLAALIADGLARAAAADRTAVVAPPSLVEGDARRVLPSLAPPPPVIYVDPMYPPKRKVSALARKGVRTIRRLVGDDDDASELVATAIACASERVVVKRPTTTGPPAGRPAASYGGKLVRYDVYRTARGGS